MTSPDLQRPEPPARWSDAEQPDPAWAPPSKTLTSRWRTPWAVTGMILAALLLIGGGLWAAGGFDRRTDTNVPAAAGATVACGPYDFVFSRATAQQQTGFDGKVSWKVIVLGTVANTGTVADWPPYDGEYGMFVARDLATREVQIPSGAKIGDGDYGDHSTVTPGLPPTAYQVEFTFSPTYRPQPTLDFHAAQLEFRNVNLLSSDKEWANADRFYQIALPIKVLPPKKS